MVISDKDRIFATLQEISELNSQPLLSLDVEKYSGLYRFERVRLVEGTVKLPQRIFFWLDCYPGEDVLQELSIATDDYGYYIVLDVSQINKLYVHWI